MKEHEEYDKYTELDDDDWVHDCYHKPEDAEKESACWQCNVILINKLKNHIKVLEADINILETAIIMFNMSHEC